MRIYRFDENPQGTSYFIGACVIQAVALLAVCLRLWSRSILRVRLQVNDWAILVALALALTNLGLLAASVTVGMGIHIGDLPTEDIFAFSKLQTALSAIWGWSLFAIKASILDIYIKIFRIPWFIKTCYIFLVIQMLWAVAMFLAIVLLCRPLAFQWDKSIPGGQCGSYYADYYATHTIIFVFDFVLALLPVPVLWKMKMEPRKKFGVILIFSLGLVILVFVLIRLAWRSKVASQDTTYEYSLLFLFSVLEAEVGIILACIPVMQPAVSRISKVGLFKGIGSFFTHKETTQALPNINTAVSLRHGMHRLGSSNDGTESTRRLDDRGVHIEMESGELHRGDGIKVTQTWAVQS